MSKSAQTNTKYTNKKAARRQHSG